METPMRIQGVEDDQAAFAAFYEQSRDPCLQALMAVVADRRVAEELAAEAFSRAWAGWRQVSRHPAPRAWVVRTALNTRVSWWRRRRSEVPWADDEAPAAADGCAPFDEALLATLRQLPVRQREVVALRVLLDLDTETTARVLGIAPGTVTAHLSRALAALRRETSDITPRPATVEISR
jgi:RNA polymerase sigma-70 factor (ECF subfamily)